MLCEHSKTCGRLRDLTPCSPLLIGPIQLYISSLTVKISIPSLPGGFSSATRDETNSGPSSGSSVGSTINRSAQTGTPFTDFVLSRLPDEESQKLFARSFGKHLHHDPDALDIDLDDVFKWLGINRKDNALRLLRKEFSDSEYILLPKEGINSAQPGPPETSTRSHSTSSRNS